jgi:hypothetical protein
MRIPAPIYELLPYAYIGAGVSSILANGDVLAWFLGGALSTVGVLVLICRWNRPEPIIGSRLR